MSNSRSSSYSGRLFRDGLTIEKIKKTQVWYRYLCVIAMVFSLLGICCFTVFFINTKLLNQFGFGSAIFICGGLILTIISIMQIVSMKGRFSKLLQDYCVSQIHEKYPSFQFGANNIDINFLRESLLFPQVIDQTGEYQYPYSWALTGELSDGLITISQLRAGDSCINDRGGRNSNTIFSGVFIKYEFNFDIKHPIIILPTKWGNQFDTSLKMKWGSPPFPENFESHDVYKNTKYSIYSNEYSHGANADFWYELITKTNELSESPISISIFDHSLFIAIPWDWDSKAKIFKPNVSLPLEQYINTILEVINILGENYRKV